MASVGASELACFAASPERVGLGVPVGRLEGRKLALEAQGKSRASVLEQMAGCMQDIAPEKDRCRCRTCLGSKHPYRALGREWHWKGCLGLGCCWHCSRRPTAHWHSSSWVAADSVVVVAPEARSSQRRLQKEDTQHTAGRAGTAVAEVEEGVDRPGRQSHMETQT